MWNFSPWNSCIFYTGMFFFFTYFIPHFLLRPSCTVFVKFFEAPYGSNNKNIYTEYIRHKIMCCVFPLDHLAKASTWPHVAYCDPIYLSGQMMGPFFVFPHTLSYLLITDMVWYLTAYRLHTWCHFPFVWTHSSTNVIFAVILWQHRVKPWYQCFPFFGCALFCVYCNF